MTLLAQAWKIAFGVLSVLLGVLIILRIFPQELTTLSCAVRGGDDCAAVPDAGPEVKIGSLIHQLQEGVKQVQQLNATQKDPHMFFVDGLQVELLFTVKETSNNKLDLVVIPASAAAGEENLNSQKLVLEFSTTTDQNIQRFITEGCEPDSLMGFDIRLEQYCRKRELVTGTGTEVGTGDPAPTQIDVGAVGITWQDFSSTRDFGYEDGTAAPLTTGSDPLCQTYNICPGTTVQRFDYDPASGVVSSFNVDVAEGDKRQLLEALANNELATEGWQIEDNPAGGLLITPEVSQ